MNIALQQPRELMMTNHHHRRGYILLLTLLLLALMAIGMTGLSRSSLELALKAQQAEVELQRRWAIQSVQRGVMTLGPLLLDQQFEAYLNEFNQQFGTGSIDESLLPNPPRTLIGSIAFGSLDIDFVFSDEQAKYNVNQLLEERADPLEASQFLDDLLTSLPGGIKPSIHLRPIHEDVAHAMGVQRVASPGSLVEVADYPLIINSLSNRIDEETWWDHVTCWGDGRLRLSRASDETLWAMCYPILERLEIDRLLDFRRQHSETTIPQLLLGVPLSAAKRAQLRHRLTETSSAYSLLMVIQGRDRGWHLLTVAESIGTSDESWFSLEW